MRVTHKYRYPAHLEREGQALPIPSTRTLCPADVAVTTPARMDEMSTQCARSMMTSVLLVFEHVTEHGL